MTGPIKNVLIIGASGNLGTPVLSEFISSSLFNISVLSRSTSSASFPSGVKEIKTDYSPPSLLSAFQNQDAVINLSKAGAISDEVLIDAAVKAGVKRFIPTEFGVNTANPAVLEKVPVLAGKAKAVQLLKSREKDGLTWTAVITGPFFDWRPSPSFLGFDIPARTAHIWDYGTTTFNTTNLSTIGKSLVAVLSTSDRLSATSNKYIYVSSHTTTQKDLLAVYEKLTDQKWKVESVDSRQVGASALERFRAGDFSSVHDLLKTGFLANDGLGDWKNATEEGKIVNEVLGLPEEEDLEADVRRLIAAAAAA